MWLCDVLFSDKNGVRTDFVSVKPSPQESNLLGYVVSDKKYFVNLLKILSTKVATSSRQEHWQHWEPELRVEENPKYRQRKVDGGSKPKLAAQIQI